MSAAGPSTLGTWLGVTNRAWLATVTTLLVAYSNQSISGALFLGAFLWWGACCISTPHAATSYRHHRRVWTATATAALLLFVLQLLAQLLYGLHLLPDAADAQPHTGPAWVAAAVLEALGLGSMEGLSGGYILLMLSAPLFCLLAATAEAAEARQVTNALRAAPPQLVVRSVAQPSSGAPAQPTGPTTAPGAAEGSARHQAGPQAPSNAQHTAASAAGLQGASASVAEAAVASTVAAFSPELSVPLTLGLQYTNSGILTAVCLFWAAVLWPSCLNLVYLMVVLWGMVCWAWNSTKTWTSAPWAVALQWFCGVHIMILYLSQLPLLQVPVLDLPFDILGLYKLSGDPALDPSRAIFATQLAHIVFLHLLYAMLGFYVALLRQPQYRQLAAGVKGMQSAPPQSRAQQQAGASAASGNRRARQGGALTDIDELLAPLLSPADVGAEVGMQAGRAHNQVQAVPSRDHLDGSQMLQQQQAARRLASLPPGGVGVVGSPAATAQGLLQEGTLSLIQLTQQGSADVQLGTNPTSPVPGASSTPATSPIAVPRGSKPFSVAAGGAAGTQALLPGTSFRGLMRGEKQDWGRIQRFITDGADEAGGSQGAFAVAVGAAGGAAVAPPAVNDAALAAATGTLAAWQTSQHTGVSAEGPELLPGGPSPEPHAAGRGTGGATDYAGFGSSMQGPGINDSFGSRSNPLGSAAAASTGFPGISAAGSVVGRWEQAVVLLQVLLPFLVSCGDYLLLQLLAAPAVAGIAIAGFALVEVSVIGCATLVLSLWSLLAPSWAGRRAFAVASPFITLAYVMWLLDDYAATALEGIVIPPPVLDSIGIWGYRRPFPALLPMLLHLLTTVTVAGLSRNQKAAQAHAATTTGPAAEARPEQNAPAIVPGSSAGAGVDRADMDAQTAANSSGVGDADGLGGTCGVPIPQGSPPLAAAGRNLRQLVSFGGRMSYTEVPFMSSLPSLLRSSSLQARTEGSASRAPSQDLQLMGHSPRQGQLSQSLQQQQDQQQQPQQSSRPPGVGAGVAYGVPQPSLGDPVNTQPWSELLGSLWGSWGTGFVQLVWELGRVAVPTACVVLAASQADVLHGVYLVIMLAYWLASCVGLQPKAQAAPLWWSAYTGSNTDRAATSQSALLQPSAQRALSKQQLHEPHALPAASLPQHRVLRLYGSCHLLVVYLALVLQLPGLDSELNEYILRLIGLWDPKILSDLVPVLLLLVAATIHVILGKWLLTRPPAGSIWPLNRPGAETAATEDPATAATGSGVQDVATNCDAGVLTWLQTVYAKPVYGLLMTAAKLAYSAGAALLVLLGYLLVLWDTPVGLLGAGYLVLLVVILLLPPETSSSDTCKQLPDRQRSHTQPQRQQRARQGAGRAAATGTDSWQLQQPLLSAVDAEAALPAGMAETLEGRAGAFTARRCGSEAAALRWLLPALLALLCALDLSAQYALVVGALIQDRPLLPADVAAFIRDVVGIDDAVRGTALLLALLRPTLLMAGLATYRYLFGVGSLCYEPQSGSSRAGHISAPAAAAAAAAAAAGDSAAPGPEAAAITLQKTWGWLVRRWLVRHADMLVGIACFAAALQAPSGLGLVLAAGSLITALQHGFANHSTAMAAAKRWQRRMSGRLSQSSSVSTSGVRGAQHYNRQAGDGAANPGSGTLSAIDQARAFKAECNASDRSLGILVDAIIAMLQVLVAAWLLAQYLLQVAWLRGLILDAASPLLPWLLLWLGLPVAGDGPTQIANLTLEAMLRMKALVLVATALRHKAQRWRQKLPAAVVAAAEAHWPCPLFWPPKQVSTQAVGGVGLRSGSGLVVTSSHAQAAAGLDGAVGNGAGGADGMPWEDLEPVLKRAGQLVSPVKALIAKLLHQVGLVTARVLMAMDLPETTTQAISYTLDPETYFGSSSTSGLASGWPARLAAWYQQLCWWLAAVSTGIRGFVEGFWLRWGTECVMLLLLAAALVGANVVSLLFLVLVVLGMVATGTTQQGWSSSAAGHGLLAGNAVPSRQASSDDRGDSTNGAVQRRQSISWWWWHLVLGVLVVVLVIQYAALLGPWPTQVPGSNLGQHLEAVADTPVQLPPLAPAQILSHRAHLEGYQHAQAATNSTDGQTSSGDGELYRSVLYPHGMLAASAAINASDSVLVITSSQQQQLRTHQTVEDEPPSPSGQLLLWYFLGLAAEQPLVLWLQAVALAVVLNVLRHMPEQQLQCLLANQSQSPSADGAAPAPDASELGCSAAVNWQREGYQVFLPLSYAWRAQWSWLDWLQFRLLKHSLDAVLVCVAALCLKQKDLLHAGYLAITLLFFRQRTALMIAPAAPQGSAVKGARLFLWLPAFNLLVMTLTMLYQAPLELLLGAGWTNTCQSEPGAAPRCSLPQLLGFCKLVTWREVLNPTPASAADVSPVSYSYSFAYGPFAGWACLSLLRSSGAVADLVLWVLLRLQYRLFKSKIYAEVVACMADEAQANAGKQQQRWCSWYNEQAQTALATSRLRLARFLRISKLKASMVDDTTEGVPYDDHMSAPGQGSGPGTLPAVLGGSSSWPNMAGSLSGRHTSAIPAAGSTGSLPGAALGRPSGQLVEQLTQGAAGASTGSLPGLDAVLPSRSGHARSASDVTNSFGLQPPAVYVVPDPRMQLLPRLSADAVPAERGMTPARASSAGAAAAAAATAQRGSLDVPSRPSFTSGHSRSRSMGYDPAVQQPGSLQLGSPMHPSVSVASGLAQPQQQQQPQHRRLGSWPSRPRQPQPAARASDGGAVPPGRTSPTQVFSSWLYGAQALPTPPRAPVPTPVRAAAQYEQSQQTASAQLERSDSPGNDPPKPGLLLGFWQWLCSTAACLLSDGSSGWEAGLCYVLFVAAFAMDFSLMSLVYLVGMLLVPLLAQQPVKLYWKAMLVYTEVLLILQYSYLTAARCLCIPGDSPGSSDTPTGSSSGSTGCVWVLSTDPTATRHMFDVLGLHRNSVSVLPLFLIYLAVLMYNYLLATQQPLMPEVVSTQTAQPDLSLQSAGLFAPPGSSAAGSSAQAGAVALEQQASSTSGRAAGSGAAVALVAALQGWGGKLWTLQRLVAHKLWYQFRCAALPHEWGPSWVKLDVAPPAVGCPAWTSPAGAAALQDSIQAALDSLQAQDAAWAVASSSGAQPAAWPADVPAHAELQAKASEGQLLQTQQQGPGQQEGQQAEERWSQWSAAGSRSPDRSQQGDPTVVSGSGAAGDGSIQQQLLAAAVGRVLGEPFSSGLAPLGLGGLTRLVLRLDRVLTDETSTLRPAGSAVALFEVWPEPIRWQTAWALPWWPRVSTRPGADAAAALHGLVGRQWAPAAAQPSTTVGTAQTQQDGQAAAVAADSGSYAEYSRRTSVSPVQPPSRDSALPSRSVARSSARASVVFDALMGMADADVQMASRLASAVALTAPGLAPSESVQTVRRSSTSASGLDTAARQQDSAADDENACIAGASAAAAAAADTAAGEQAAGSSHGVLTAGTEVTVDSTVPAVQQEQQQLQTQQQQEQQWGLPQGGADPRQQQQQPPAQPMQPQQPQCAGHHQQPVTILGVEHFSRPQQDYYSITALLDFASFIYLALFYQVVMSSARSLADLTDEKQLPWDYLSALLLLFVITVVDRLVYSLGSHLGKALLLLGQLVLFIPFCMSLYWSPVASTSSSRARQHIRVFMVLKAASWVSSALQLRSGFPPRASFDGGGRQRFVFYKKADGWYLTAFYVFQAVPFLYELRALLDWTCSATPLNWYQWLKLEDIRASLFVEECRGAYRAQRAIGERVPRYMKFLQGTLLFCLLLLAIWAPLLLFSSGAPTYQTPGIVGARTNASFGVVTSYGHYQGVMSFPVFEASARRTVENWAPGPASSGDSTSGTAQGELPHELSGYSPDQVKLICLSQDSDHLWRLSPPARSALKVVMSEPHAALHMTWAITRTAPLASGKGGPECAADVTVTLAGESRQQLLEMLDGSRDWAQLMAINASDPHGWAPGHTGSTGLYWLFWRLRGEACAIKTYMGPDAAGDDSTSQPKGPPNILAPTGKSRRRRAVAGRAAASPSVAESAVYSWAGSRGSAARVHAAAARRAQLRAAKQAQSPVLARHQRRASAQYTATSSISRRPHRAADREGDNSFVWSQLQVGCNVSVAGNDSDGGAWWVFHCGLVSPDGALVSRLKARPRLAGGARLPHGSSTSRMRSGSSSSRGEVVAGIGGQQVPGGHSPMPPEPPAPQPTPPGPPGPDPGPDPEPDPDPGPGPDPDPDPDRGSGYASCGPAVQGPLLVVVLERVQSGLLGAALSAFGITGLYFSVVFGIGRFLRLTVSNIRLRIAYEDFPSTQRLVAMVQDIYIARAEGELQLEEELFYLLLKIYKTPKLLNELTRLSQQTSQQVV